MPAQGINKHLLPFLAARRDAQQVTELCVFCPGWRFEGRADEGRVAAREHRITEHAKPAARKTTSMTS